MKKVIIVIVSIVMFFLLILTVYKFKPNKIEYKEHYFEYNEIKEFKDDNETEVNDIEVYKDKIISQDLKKIEYNFFHNIRSIFGTIYIGEDEYLYITDSVNNIVHKLSNIKFKTMYYKDYQYKNAVYINLLSKDGKLYSLSLKDNDVRNAKIYEYEYDKKFLNFVTLEMKHDMYAPSNSIFALSEDGKIYDINNRLRYNEKTISLYNSILVFENNTMSNLYGRVIEDKNGNRYKIKYVFATHKNNDFIDINPIVIITEDSKFIYLAIDVWGVYEFDKKVKDIKFDVYYPYVRGNLEITFEDDYKVNFEAECNQYYCINEFAE